MSNIGTRAAATASPAIHAPLLGALDKTRREPLPSRPAEALQSYRTNQVCQAIVQIRNLRSQISDFGSAQNPSYPRRGCLALLAALRARTLRLRDRRWSASPAGVHRPLARGQRLDELAVEVRAAGPEVAAAAGELDLLRRAEADDHVVAQGVRLGDDLAERVEDHRAAGLDRVVVHADGVGEDVVHAVLIGPGGQPAHQPAASLGPSNSMPQRHRVALAVLPEPRGRSCRGRAWGWAGRRSRAGRRSPRRP